MPAPFAQGSQPFGNPFEEYGFFASLRMTLVCHCEHTEGMRGNPFSFFKRNGVALKKPLIRHAFGVPPILLRCPKYSAAFALNILTAAPNLARFIVHRTRFASFVPREGFFKIQSFRFRRLQRLFRRGFFRLWKGLWFRP